MKESKFSKCYFGHLFFYYLQGCFMFPSIIIDDVGMTIGIGFWGLNWVWKRETD